jgi:predicted N-acetyltransferase YhbS
MIIRNELESDYRETEELTRKAFWNVYVPGCEEHYLVHVMREHEDFIPELDFVMEQDGCLIANVMYTKAKLVDEYGNEKPILTFGPLSVLPGYQRKGYGKLILEHSFQKALELGYDTIVIFGNPENYICRGFKNCKKFNISIGDGIFPTAMLVKELCEGAVPKKDWVYSGSSVYEIDKQAADEFDKNFEFLAKEYQPSQELFDIYSHSRVFE